MNLGQAGKNAVEESALDMGPGGLVCCIFERTFDK